MPTHARGGGGYVSAGPRGKTSILVALLLTPFFVMAFPLWAALYPLSALATILTGAMSGNRFADSHQAFLPTERNSPQSALLWSSSSAVRESNNFLDACASIGTCGT